MNVEDYKEHLVYGRTREYYSVLMFHTGSFWDSKDNNSWELYGTRTAYSGTMPYLEEFDPIIDGWVARCDIHNSKFDKLPETLKRNNCLTIINTGGYMRHISDIKVNGKNFTICCWFRINSDYNIRHTVNKNYSITLMGWKDGTGKEVAIDILTNKSDLNLTNLVHKGLRLSYGTKNILQEYKEPGPGIHTNEWMFFSFQHCEDGKDYIHLNGKKLLEATSSINTVISDFKIGAFKTTSAGGLDIDEVAVMNQCLGIEEYDTPEGHIYWSFPEVYYVEDFWDKNSMYYKLGEIYGWNYLKFYPIEINGATLKFSSITGKPVVLFRNGIYVDVDYWKISGSTVTLTDASMTTDTELFDWILVTYVDEAKEEIPKGAINGASEWDGILDNLKITREKEDNIPNNLSYLYMYNKIEWYKHNKIPVYNFPVIDKFNIEFKE